MSGRLLLLAESDDDGDFGDPSAAERRGLEDSRARLATLFDSGLAQLGGKTVEEALSYSAPKEPSSSRANDAPTNENASAKPVFSSAVHAFVLDGEKYQPQGKVGLALIHAKNGKPKLILYLASKKLLCQSIITEEYVAIVKDLYVSFADQHNRPWSIAFDDRSSLCQFARVLVAIVGALKTNHSYSLDLLIGEGDPIASGDSIELSSLHFSVDEDVRLAEYRSEEALRLKVGRTKGAIEPWETALVGMRRHGQRVIAAPTGSSHQLVADEQALEVVVVTLKRVKFADASKNEAARSARVETPTSSERAPHSSSSSVVEIPTAERETAPESPDNRQSPPPKTPDALSPMIEQESTTKKPSDLRSRMARIGQPLIALAALPRVTSDPPAAPTQQSSSSAAQSTPSSPCSALSDDTVSTAVAPAIASKPVAESQPAVVPDSVGESVESDNSVDKSSAASQVTSSEAGQLHHPQPLPFFFPYGGNPTAQGFPASIPHFPFVPVPMHSAQPSLGDLEERLIAKFKELQAQFQESIALLVSKTVSDSVSSQMSSISTASEKKRSTTDGVDTALSSLSGRIERLEKKIDELSSASAVSRQSQSSDDTDRRVKRIMSRLYKSAVDAFPNSEQGYSAETIHASLLTLIKEATLSSLEPAGANAGGSDSDAVYAVVKNCVDTVAN